MTVRDLIQLLKVNPPDMEVVVDAQEMRGLYNIEKVEKRLDYITDTIYTTKLVIKVKG